MPQSARKPLSTKWIMPFFLIFLPKSHSSEVEISVKLGFRQTGIQKYITFLCKKEVLSLNLQTKGQYFHNLLGLTLGQSSLSILMS